MNSVYIGIDEIIKTLCLRDGDDALMRSAIYESYISNVYNDLRFDITRVSVTKKFYVDKKNNSLALPNELLLLISVGYIDDCGAIQPFYFNPKIPRELLFENSLPCDCSCGCNGECNNAKINSKVVDKVDVGGGDLQDRTITIYTLDNGKVIKETKSPYINSRDEIAYNITEEEVCSLKLKKCGCLEDSGNINAVKKIVSCCGTMNYECGKDVCEQNNQYGYTISQQGNILIFSNAYKLDHVVLKYYTIAKTKSDFKIPAIAKECFIQGLRYYDAINDSKIANTAMFRNTIYKAEREKVKRRLHPYNAKLLLKSVGINI